MSVIVVPPAHVAKAGWQEDAIDVTSHGAEFRPLSPFLLGPVPLYAGYWSKTMENAWQYAKVYPGQTYEDYWWRAFKGWADPRAVRYPMGKGAKPLYTLWAGDHLDYITARRRVYIPLYAWAVRFYQPYLLAGLKAMHEERGDLVLTDFDSYDHRPAGLSWEDVISDPDRKMGHGFVLAMMIEGYL